MPNESALPRERRTSEGPRALSEEHLTLREARLIGRNESAAAIFSFPEGMKLVEHTGQCPECNALMHHSFDDDPKAY